MSAPCSTSQGFPPTDASLADAVAPVHGRDLEPGHRGRSLPLELRYPLDNVGRKLRPAIATEMYEATEPWKLHRDRSEDDTD